MKRGLLAFICAAMPLAAASQNDDRLVDRYTVLAGSKQNAKSLVSGLLEGKEIKLARGGTTQTFTPPTGKLEYGNVDITLALAEASLKERRITKPTPAQLQTTVMEILKLRADGKGWAEISKTHGYKFADVKPAVKPAEPKPAAVAQKPAESKRAEKKPSPAVVPTADFGYRSRRLDSP
jgi:hypothetical protein